MKMKMKKFGKMRLIFEFSKSKLGYMELSKKIYEKMFQPIFGDETENENEKKMGR